MLKRMSVTDSIDDIAAEFDEAGAVIIENLLSRDVVDRFNNDVNDYVLKAEHKGFVSEGLEYFFKEQTRNVSGLADKSDTFADEILVHPTYLGLGERFLIPHCNTFQLNSAIVFDRGPGSEGQVLHRDEGIWDKTPDNQYQFHFGSIIALGEFTAEMGATQVVPGSHRWPSDREATPEEVETAVMEPGSAVLYFGSTLHQAAANTTKDKWRRGLHVSYCLGWLRPEENHVLSSSLERARTLSDDALSLLGYASHDRFPRFGGGYSGAVDMRNPLELIRSGEL